MQTIKAVTYDMDGMILRGKRFSDMYIEKFGISKEQMSPFFDGPFRECLVGKADLKEELQKGWLERWGWKGSVDDLLDYWFACGDTVNADVIATIKKLHEEKVLCLLTTNQEKYRTHYIEETLGLGKLFDQVFSSARIGFKKPEPEFLQVVMDWIEGHDDLIKKENVLYWDDRGEFVKGAEKFGLTARIYTEFIPYKKEMKSLGLLN